MELKNSSHLTPTSLCTSLPPNLATQRQSPLKLLFPRPGFLGLPM